MSAIPTSFPQRVDSLELARNAQVPDSRFVNQLCNAQNFVNAYSRKQAFAGWNSFDGTGTTGPVIMRGYFHSGHAVQSACWEYLMALAGTPSGGAGPSNDPYITIAMDKASGGAAVSYDLHWGANTQSVADSLTNMLRDRRYFSLVADTDYVWSVTSNAGARMPALAIWEVGKTSIDNTVNWFIGPSHGYSDIYDANRQRISQGLSELWKRNGAHLMNWSRGGRTSATVTGATWTNVIDATTAVATTSVGYVLGSGLLTPYLRQSGTAVNVVLAAYGSVAGGGGTGEVRLQTDNATTFATVTGINGTPGWFTLAQGTVATGSFGKADLQFRMNGAGTLSLEAVSCFLYDA